MPQDEARSMLQMIEERIRSSEIDVRHRDALIWLRSMIEDDLATAADAQRDKREFGQNAA